MALNRTRRLVLAAFCATTALLAACGSSTTESAITPSRFIGFGDAHSDVGQTGKKYTVNDGTVNNWAAQVAQRYGKTLTPSSTGGQSYAIGNARVALTPDAAGNASTPTVQAQITAFLSKNTLGTSDVVLINGGISDLIVNMAAVQAGTLTEAGMVTNAQTAGKALATEVRRLVTAGAKYVVVSGTYDLSKTPWAKTIGKTALLTQASSQFNEALLVSLVDLSANVLYLDAAYFVNLYDSTPAAYGFGNRDQPPVCNSVDSTNGIGIGTNQVNSLLCTPTTVLAGANPTAYIYADPVYFTPSAHRQLGDYAYDKIRERW